VSKISIYRVKKKEIIKKQKTKKRLALPCIILNKEFHNIVRIEYYVKKKIFVDTGNRN
jgi:hypothetical protein